MDSFNLTPAQRAAAALLLAAGVLLGAGSWTASRQPQGAPESNADFQQAAAGIYGRIQLMRSLERQLLASAAQPERAALYLDKRHQARRQIDELMRDARATAADETAREHVERLAMLTAVADTRFEQISAHAAAKATARTARYQAP